MKFLANESVEHSIVSHLSNQGYDIVSVAENFPGLKDTDVLTLSAKEHRVLLTNDKDFGELVYKEKLFHSGVVLFRLPQQDVPAKIVKLDLLLQKYKSRLKDNFIVVTKINIRIRKSTITTTKIH